MLKAKVEREGSHVSLCQGHIQKWPHAPPPPPRMPEVGRRASVMEGELTLVTVSFLCHSQAHEE